MNEINKLIKEVDQKYPLVSRKVAAKMLGVTVKTLATAASRGRGYITSTRIGTTAYYRLSDIAAYLDSRGFGEKDIVSRYEITKMLNKKFQDIVGKNKLIN